MTMNKRAAIVGCASALALVMAGCSGGEDPSNATNTSATNSTNAAAAASSSISNGSTASSDQPTCEQVSEEEVAALFDRWNEDLASGDPQRVVENYAQDSVLLPTVSNQVRVSAEEKADYFEHWLPNQPQGVVNQRWIERDCDRAVDAGTYTFAYADGTKVAARYTFVYVKEDGEWKIRTHHSSAMPEEGADTSLPAASGTTGSPADKLDAEQCHASTAEDVAAEFDEWNAALGTGDPRAVVHTYAADSVLLPTVSNQVRFTEAEKEDYFAHFLEKQPAGRIDQRWTDLGCNTATDSGLYTFTYADGTETKARFTYTYRWDGQQWQISSHHSSMLPEQ